MTQELTQQEPMKHELTQQEIVNRIVLKHKGKRGALIAILEEIQKRYGYLQEDNLKKVSEFSGYPLVDIYGVVTFYKLFRLKPRGKHLITICRGTACHVRAAPRLVAEFEKELGIMDGETTEDGNFTLETVACLGACALGPIVVIDNTYFSKVKPKAVKGIINETLAGFDQVDVSTDERVIPVKVNCPRCNHSLMDNEYLIDGYPSILVTVSYKRVHSWLRLSSLYGSYSTESEQNRPFDSVSNFFCPHCHSELVSAWNCTECAALMVPMIVRGGGMIQICSRRGCKGHMLDLDGINL